MMGLMMDRPLLTTEILKHAVRNYRNTEIVTRTVEGPIHRYTIADSAKRIARLANALTNLGVKKGDRVGVIAVTADVSGLIRERVVTTAM